MTHPPDGDDLPGARSPALPPLTAFAQELAGSFRPATIVDRLAALPTELLTPDRMEIVLRDVRSNQLSVAHSAGTVTGRTDHPVVQLALRRGALVVPQDVRAAVADLGVYPGPLRLRSGWTLPSWPPAAPHQPFPLAELRMVLAAIPQRIA